MRDLIFSVFFARFEKAQRRSYAIEQGVADPFAFLEERFPSCDVRLLNDIAMELQVMGPWVERRCGNTPALADSQA